MSFDRIYSHQLNQQDGCHSSLDNALIDDSTQETNVEINFLMFLPCVGEFSRVDGIGPVVRVGEHSYGPHP